MIYENSDKIYEDQTVIFLSLMDLLLTSMLSYLGLLF